MTHDKRKPYKCCVCDYTSLDVGLVTYHIATTHFKQKAHKCDKCDKTFALVGLLKKHKLTHAKDEPCVCDHCGMALRNKYNLRLHIDRLHSQQTDIDFVDDAVNSD